MAGFFRIFAAMSVAGVGWSVGRRLGKQLWKEAGQHYPEVRQKTQDLVNAIIEPVLAATKTADSEAEADDAETNSPQKEEEAFEE